MLVQSLRITRRDWCAGELRFLLVALIVAVAALSSVGFFVDRMRAQLARDANQLLAADLVIRTDEPIEATLRNDAERRGLQLAETVVFPSMAGIGTGDDSVARLASIKAVSAGYPLRGAVKIADAIDAEGMPASAIPAPGTVWADAALLSSLGGAWAKSCVWATRLSGLPVSSPSNPIAVPAS